MKKNFKVDTATLLKCLLVAIIACNNGVVNALRIGHNGQEAITSSSDILMVGVPARLTCNYIKFQSEKIREITWYAGYNGMSRKV